MKCVKILAKWPGFGRRVPQANTHLRPHLNREAPCFGIMGPAAEALPGRTTLSPRPPPVTPPHARPLLAPKGVRETHLAPRGSVSVYSPPA